jgi:hypothetical protein
MDFSEAERSGFINGFIQFWTMRANNTRTAKELAEAAKAILRGCEEHFRAAVTRVSRINGAVGPNKVEAFKTRTLGLLSVASGDEFLNEPKLRIGSKNTLPTRTPNGERSGWAYFPLRTLIRFTLPPNSKLTVLEQRKRRVN